MAISKRIGWSGEYIESLPRLDRVAALRVIEKIVAQENAETQRLNAKTRK